MVKQPEEVADDLGPLPKADAAGALQRVSLVAFEERLPAGDFVFRRELEHDLGVDGSLEVLLSGLATNMRSQLQLKGRSGTTENKDGSVSVSVDTANLNHMLNGTCPIYVLYRAESGELRYAFARNEWKRISKTKPDWRGDSTVTLRFHDLVDDRALARIRNSIVTEAKLQRKLWERLMQVAPALRAGLYVDVQKAQVSDPAELAEELASQGFQLVTAGLAQTAIEKGRLIPAHLLAARPALRVVLAFAEYAEGHFSEAEGHLREALAAEGLLGSEDQSFAWYLHHSISHATGRIGRDEFFRAMDQWRSSAPEHLLQQYDFVRRWEVYKSALQQGDPVAIDGAIRDLRLALPQAASGGSPAIREQAQLTGLLLDAQELTSAFIDAQAQTELRKRRPDSSPETTAWLRNWDEWHARVADLSSDARRRGNLRLACEAQLLLTHAELIVARLDGLRRSQAEPNLTLDLPELKRRVEELIEAARAIRSPELELQAQLNLAEIADVAGDAIEAERLARDVLKRAGLFRFAGLERAAKRIIGGQDGFAARVAELERFERDHGASFLRSVDEHELAGIAHESCKTLGIPTSRAHNVFAGLLAEKLVVEDQSTWCQFLQYREQRPADDDTVNLFVEPTEKQLLCSELGHESRFPHVDGRVVLQAFKQTYCDGCPRRTPGSATA